MSDNSDEKEVVDISKMSKEEQKDYALIEILMRLSAIEKALIEKDVIKQEDLLKHIKNSTNTLLIHMEAGADQTIVSALDNKNNLKN